MSEAGEVRSLTGVVVARMSSVRWVQTNLQNEEPGGCFVNLVARLSPSDLLPRPPLP